MQLLKKTNVETTFTFCLDHPIVQVMTKLNKKKSITLEEINDIRDKWNYPLSKRGMEDAAEFYLCFMNEVFSYVKYFTDRSIDSLLSSSPFKSIGNAFYNAYVMMIKISWFVAQNVIT